MNTKQINGVTVVSLDTGERLGSVTDVVLDGDGHAIIALAVQAGGGLLSAEPSETRWLAAEAVHAIGPDALTVASASALREAAPGDGALPVDELLKRKVVTEGGIYVGQVASVEVDEHSMGVTHLEASPGFFKSNRMIPVDQVVNIGQELVIVIDAVCAEEESAQAEPVQAGRIVGDVEPRPTT